MKTLLAALLCFPLLGWAETTQTTRLSYGLEGDGQTLTFTRLASAPTSFVVTGLPFPGQVLWRPTTQELAYQHPTEGSWLRATPALLPESIVSTTSVPAAASHPWQGQATRRWVQKYGAQNCGALFASVALGAQHGLTITSFQSLYRLLYWLNTGQPPIGCANAQTLPATAPNLGLPTRWASPMGALVLQNIEATTAPQLTWPPLTYPVTEETRLNLLLAQLPIPARAAFLQQYASLPLQAQVVKLAALLASLTPTDM